MQRARGETFSGEDGNSLLFARFHTIEAYEEQAARIDRDILFADERQVRSTPK